MTQISKSTLLGYIATIPIQGNATKNRVKRDNLFRWMGEGIGNLLGLETYKDRKKLIDIIDGIADNQDIITKGLNDQIVVLNLTLGEILRIDHAMQSLKGDINNIKQSLYEIKNFNNDLMLISIETILAQSMSVNLNYLNSQIIQFISSIKQIGNGKTDSYAIPLPFLKEIINTMPENIRKLLPFKMDEDSLGLFYGLSWSLILRRNRFLLQIVISLPLTSINQEFALYEVSTSPLKIQNKAHPKPIYIQYEIKNKFLGVDKNEHLFAEFADLDQCNVINQEVYCNLRNASATRKSRDCLVQAYIDPSRTQIYRQEKIKTHLDTIFLKYLAGYRFHVIGSLRFKLKCPDQKDRNIILSGSGIISLPNQCILISEEYILPSIDGNDKSSEIIYKPQLFITNLTYLDLNNTIFNDKDLPLLIKQDKEIISKKGLHIDLVR